MRNKRASACVQAVPRARTARATGFTLLEVLVALAVFSLAALALIRETAPRVVAHA